MPMVHGGSVQRPQSFTDFFHTAGALPHADITRHSATSSSRQTRLNRAGHILCRCHIAFYSAVGNWQSHRLLYHRFHTHTRHGALKEQTAMLALVRDMVVLFVLSLVHMHRATAGASHYLVHQFVLIARMSLKGTTTSFSLHTTL